VAKSTGRVTVVQSVHHQTEGVEPHSIESGFSQECAVEEEPYRRRTTIGEKWQNLDCGWLSQGNAGMLVVKNHGKNLVELSYCPSESGCSWFVDPGGSMQGRPSDAPKLFIRCVDNTSEVTIFVTPK
jgi:hypothetical protein